jgi:hypothetical protein
MVRWPLYGSTWWVNTVVSGISSSSSSAPHRRPVAGAGERPWLSPAVLTLLLPGALFALALAAGGRRRGVFLGPVFFGGLVFARLIEGEARLYEAYGSNVLGAVIGGATEYLSLVFGFRFLLAVALAFYVAVFVLLRRGASR